MNVYDDDGAVLRIIHARGIGYILEQLRDECALSAAQNPHNKKYWNTASGFFDLMLGAWEKHRMTFEH